MKTVFIPVREEQAVRNTVGHQAARAGVWSSGGAGLVIVWTLISEPSANQRTDLWAQWPMRGQGSDTFSSQLRHQALPAPPAPVSCENIVWCQWHSEGGQRPGCVHITPVLVGVNHNHHQCGLWVMSDINPECDSFETHCDLAFECKVLFLLRFWSWKTFYIWAGYNLHLHTFRFPCNKWGH